MPGARCSAGEPGAGSRDASAGATSGREVDDRQPAGVSRRHCYRAIAGSGDSAAGNVRAHHRRRTRRQTCRRSVWFGTSVCGTWRALESAIVPAARQLPVLDRPIVHFDGVRHTGPLSVRRALAGKHIMLIGVTGFIGKVWLVEHADGFAGDREDLSADPAAEIESGDAAV